MLPMQTSQSSQPATLVTRNRRQDRPDERRDIYGNTPMQNLLSPVFSQCNDTQATLVVRQDRLDEIPEKRDVYMKTSVQRSPSPVFTHCNDTQATLVTQQDRLVKKRDIYEKTPSIFASPSHLIGAGKLEQAIETLEHGRALLWFEMHGLLTSIDRLCTVDPVLTKSFTTINRKLEILTPLVSSSRDISKSIGMDIGGFKGDERMAQFPGLMEKQQNLLKERDALILKIQGLPGLENVLFPPSFDTLRSAASHWPVIIINHCELRSDIIIVLHNSRPSHIPTPHDFFDRANQLKDRLLNTREKYGLNSRHHEVALSSVLTELYELVGEPDIKRLNELGIAQQSRIWWCPTSAFWDLPLHAMGPIQSDGRVAHYFSDLYISSYTATLSALLASRRPSTHTSAQPSQPTPAWEDTLGIRGLDLQTTSLTSGNMTPKLDDLLPHQFAHAYHETSETAKPFDAGVLLYNGESLTLLDIVWSLLPTGEFAFLPGSHTAELTDRSIPDEALHLSAALQFSGFRCVIGTMWGMDNEVGRDLAKNIYRSMFLGKESVEPYYERSARALQHALQQMRRGLPLVRWVNYVHFGA